ncbi:MAG: STAS/SEC14 domain-containing protein [Desulfobacterales bacterium]
MEEAPVGKVVTLKVRETLRKKDYDDFVPMLEGLMKNGSKIRLNAELHDFEGWTAGALWEDTKFAARHFGDIERLAVVGEAPMGEGDNCFYQTFHKG